MKEIDAAQTSHYQAAMNYLIDIISCINFPISPKRLHRRVHSERRSSASPLPSRPGPETALQSSNWSHANRYQNKRRTSPVIVTRHSSARAGLTANITWHMQTLVQTTAVAHFPGSPIAIHAGSWITQTRLPAWSYFQSSNSTYAFIA